MYAFFLSYLSIVVWLLPQLQWWFHRRDRRGSRSGRGQAGSNLGDMDNREPGQYGRNDLLNRGLQEWRPKMIRGGKKQKVVTESPRTVFLLTCSTG